MNDKLELKYKNITYNFERNPEDTPEDFYHICWLTVKQEPTTSKDFEHKHQMAIMWYYQKKYKCKYSDYIQKDLKKLGLLSYEL